MIVVYSIQKDSYLYVSNGNKMTQIQAKQLEVGMKYKSSSSIQEVTAIVKVSDKAIEYRTKRIAPDYYEGDFFQRKRLTTKIELV